MHSFFFMNNNSFWSLALQCLGTFGSFLLHQGGFVTQFGHSSEAFTFWYDDNCDNLVNSRKCTVGRHYNSDKQKIGGDHYCTEM